MRASPVVARALYLHLPRAARSLARRRRRRSRFLSAGSGGNWKRRGSAAAAAGMGYRVVSSTVMNGVRASRRRRRQPVGRSAKSRAGRLFLFSIAGLRAGSCRAVRRLRAGSVGLTVRCPRSACIQRAAPPPPAAAAAVNNQQQPPQLRASAALLTAPFRGPLGAARSDGAASHPSKLIVSPQ